MTIAITWSNAFKIVSLVAIILGLLLSAGVATINWQLDTINRRLEERLKVYQAQQTEQNRYIERLGDRVLRLEQQK